MELVGAVWGFDGEGGAVGGVGQVGDAGFPAQVDAGFAAGFDQDFLQVVLLEVDEGGEFVAGFGKEIEGEDLFFTGEDAAGVPGDALGQQGLADAEAGEDFEAALGVADGAAADADGVVVVDQDDRLAPLGEVQCGGEADHAAADDHDGVAAALVGDGAEGIAWGGVGHWVA